MFRKPCPACEELRAKILAKAKAAAAMPKKVYVTVKGVGLVEKPSDPDNDKR